MILRHHNAQNDSVRRWILAVVGVLFVALPARSADEPPQDLRTLRAVFRHALITAVLPEKRAWLEKLHDLEKKLASAHDYPDAIRAREEREALEQELLAFEHELPLLAARAAGDGPLLAERIPLKMESVALSGVKADKDGALTGWNQPGSSAVWTLPALPRGGYEVIVKYASDAEEGAAWAVHEAFYFLHIPAVATKGKVIEKNLGTLRISNGAGSLTLTAEGDEKTASLRLVSLELAPVNR